MTLRQELDMDESRRKLSKALAEWAKTLKEFMPPEALQTELGVELFPEKEKLRLPSDYPRFSHETLGLLGLADSEYRLRVAQAYDALQKIRAALGLKSFLVRRKHDSSGQSALLRSEAEIERAQRQVDKWAEVYERAWDAMDSLRDANENGCHDSRLKVLNRGRDLIMLSKWLDEHRLWRERGEVAEAASAKRGEGHQELSWIWKVEFQMGTSSDAVDQAVHGWTAEAIRLEWLHAKASLQRFEEEMILLEAESERVGRTFRHYQKVWRARAVRSSENEEEVTEGRTRSRKSRGVEAYAKRCANTFGRMAMLAEGDYFDVMTHKRVHGV
ncbi:hypothetical protein M422DRAFT_269618 [Sphaerobolus stellatus SS14]|uniref:Uncharacterized protein n=1 Tax=Sphaerobolus stellatus (strain SS14) TaxID=990650 RepID=A0A0C9UJD4_SPHS4|nr:hypothetical protein M422DRAFT_269618 [Sphaerobolus stellatus SS14]